MKSAPRPLSPHLQIYRWQWTMLYSILHRASGVALALGVVLLVFWLLALASGPAAFATVHGLATSVFGMLLLLGWTWSLCYHLLNGVRHLFWDLGKGFELEVAALSGHCVAAGSAALTLLVWLTAWLL